MKAARVRLGDLSVAFVHGLVAALADKGVAADELLRQFRLDAARLALPRERMSIPRYMRLGHSAIALCGDPALGLEMGRHSRIGQAGLAGVTAAQAPTLREAARTLIRLEPLYAHNYRGHSSFIEDAGGAHAASYTHRDETVACVSPPHLVEERRRELGARAAEWMAEGDRAAVDVEAFRIDRQLAQARQHLRRERLVQLDEVDLIERQSGACQRLAHRGHRANPEPLRLDAGGCKRDEPGERLESSLLCSLG